MQNTPRSGRLVGAASILLLGLAPTSFALQDPETPVAESETAKEKPEPPVKRAVRFESADADAVKQRLEIYNRVKTKEKLYCRKDMVTGSHRKKVRCVTEATRQMEEDAARLFFHSLGRGG
ncbi:MAG: hypothetical protein AB8G16_08605 [Gammaproteobacteria bacterium]